MLKYTNGVGSNRGVLYFTPTNISFYMKPLFRVLLMLMAPLLIKAQPVPPAFSSEISFSSAVFQMQRAPTIYYEITLINNSKKTYELQELLVTDYILNVSVWNFSYTELHKIVGRKGEPLNAEKPIPVQPGERVVFYMQIPWNMSEDGSIFFHRLSVSSKENGVTKTEQLELASLPSSPKRSIVIGPPVAKGIWTAVYSPAWERGHRRVYYSVDNIDRIPGRFAIDFIKMNDDGKFAKGDDNEIKNWFGYGTDVLAVDDGVVASVNDSFPESATLKAHPRYAADKATGNYISIKIGEEIFAFYEHLKPGSIKVRPGQKVRKGDVIASLGFTGQTTGPHLHFHVADKNSPLGAEGIAFVFDDFESLGSYDRFEDFGKKKWTANKSNQGVRIEERPTPNQVIRFSK